MEEECPHEACKILKGLFGEDFYVPDKSETAKNVRRPVVSTGHSA